MISNGILISAIDLFCWIGWLSYGLKKAWINVKVWIDIDNTCEFAYTKNVKSDFVSTNIALVKWSDLIKNYWNNKDEVRILAGCAPCQPFSMHSNKLKGREDSEKWNLLKQFQRLIMETNPTIVSMENVPNLANQEIFKEFVAFLERNKYKVSYQIVYCPDYWIPQKRKRLVLLASNLWDISLIEKTHTKNQYKTVQDIIWNLPLVKSWNISKNDPLHKAIKLSEKNLKRIKASKPNWTWMDWSEDLRLECHKKNSGSTYKSVYGRMSWNEPSPTITTQFYNFWTGRFWHPEQDRALTIREWALLQTFPEDYVFYKDPSSISISKIGIHIGNAVPVDLGYIIGKSINIHLDTYLK